jgi:endonuclease/exonuclease/phosphatase family metal-dependent hydrolase
MKILSWNILANEFIKQSYYDMIPSQILFNRSKRQERIIETLKEANADIMLLQEVMQSEYNQLEDEFQKTYYLVKGKHIKWYNKRSYSGNVILLRKKMFSSTNKQLDLSFGIAIQTQLKEKTEMPILIINVHLDDSFQATRLRQIKDIEMLFQNHPRIILGGDFNEHYNPKHITKLYNTLKEYYFTLTNHALTYYIKYKACIDHIMLKGFENNNIISNVINEYGNNSVEHFTKYGSDHLPVLLKIQ